MAKQYLYPNELGEVVADGYPGHFIAADRCRFRLHHHILSMSGTRYRVSTIGQYVLPIEKDFDIYEPLSITPDSIFETSVFEEYERDDGFLDVDKWSEIDKEFSDNSITATENHYKMIEKYRVL